MSKECGAGFEVGGEKLGVLHLQFADDAILILYFYFFVIENGGMFRNIISIIGSFGKQFGLKIKRGASNSC